MARKQDSRPNIRIEPGITRVTRFIADFPPHGPASMTIEGEAEGVQTRFGYTSNVQVRNFLPADVEKYLKAFLEEAFRAQLNKAGEDDEHDKAADGG